MYDLLNKWFCKFYKENPKGLARELKKMIIKIESESKID